MIPVQPISHDVNDFLKVHKTVIDLLLFCLLCYESECKHLLHSFPKTCLSSDICSSICAFNRLINTMINTFTADPVKALHFAILV